jgi:hypothetical protein
VFVSGEQAPIPTNTVQLRHELPDGTWHIDWMLDLDPVGEGPLTTLRLPGRVDELAPGDRMSAERIADHRRRYLTYEGPIGEGRGSVVRVAEGLFEAVQSVGDAWAFVIRWDSRATPDGIRRLRRQTLRVHADGEGAWTVVCRGAAGGNGATNVIV